MTNPLQTIPNLPPALALDGSEQVWLNQAGADVRTTVAAIGTITAPFVYLPLVGGTLTGPLTIQADLTVEGYIHTPTPPPGTNSDAVATTAFVSRAVSGVLAGYLPIIGGTIQGNLAVTGTTTLNGATALNGVTTAATQPPGDNSTKLATTAFVEAALTGSTAGVTSWNGRQGAVTLTTADLTGAGGATSAQLANYLPLAGGAITGNLSVAGNLTAVTPAAADNSTEVATTAFVKGAIAALPPQGVTSVGLAAPSIFTVTGSPVTSSGVLTLTSATQTANTIYAGPTSGGALAPTFRLPVASDFTAWGVATTVQLAGYLPLTGGTLSGNLTAPDVIWTGAKTANFVLAAPSGAAGVPTFRALVAADIPSLSGAYLPLTGGTLSGPGNLTVGGTAAINGVFTSGAYNGMSLAIQPPAGNGGYIYFGGFAGQGMGFTSNIGGNRRWLLQIGDGTAESGSNAGSNFILASYSDAGAYISSVLSIARANGQAVFSGNIIGNGNINIGGSVNASGWIQQISAGDAALVLNKNASGNGNYITARTGASINRWQIVLGDTAAEGGNNTGSNLAISRFADNGNYLDEPIYINRNTGFVGFNVTPGCPSAPAGQAPSGGYIICGFYQSGGWNNAQSIGVNTSENTGLIFNNGTNFQWSGAVSDRRAKSNLKPAGNAIDVVKNLPVYDLDFKPISTPAEGYTHQTEHWPFSLIADEVAAVLPHAAIPGVNDDKDQWVALHPHHLVAVLWRAVQQLTERDDAMTARIAALEARA